MINFHFNKEKYIDTYEEIQRSLIKTFESNSNEFDYDSNLFVKHAEKLKELENQIEFFLNSDLFFQENELMKQYRFNQCREETLKFLKDLPDFSLNFTSFFQYREIYLKIHAPHL